MGGHCVVPTGEDRQRHQELLEHPPQKEAEEGAVRSRRCLMVAPNGEGAVGEEASD